MISYYITATIANNPAKVPDALCVRKGPFEGGCASCATNVATRFELCGVLPTIVIVVEGTLDEGVRERREIKQDP